jgi:hypothetical protein
MLLAAMRKEDELTWHANPLLVGVFLVLITMPLVVHLFSTDQNLSLSEKRTLARLPGMPHTFSELLSFPKKFNLYIDDHFGCRRFLLRFGSRISYALGISASRKVLLGKEGWMFLGQIQNVVQQYRGIDRFSPTELSRWVEQMTVRKRWLERRNIGFFILIAPDKHTIYPEFLPETVGKPVDSTRLDQLVEYTKRHSELSVIDVRDAIRCAKSQGLLYRKTDTHWTELAGFIAYRELMRRLKPLYPAVSVVTRDMYRVEERELPGGGLSRMIHLGDDVKERVPFMLPKEKPAAIQYNRSEQKGVPEEVKTHYYKTGKENLPSVVIFRDSFIWGMMRFLMESFNRTIIVHHRGMKFDCDIIEKQKPDMVIYEVVERSLNMPVRNPPGLK